MTSSLFRFHEWLHEKKVFLSIYQIGLLAVIIGIFYSRAVLSIGQLVIAGNFLVEGGLKEKFTDFLKQPLAILLVSLYLLHVLGILYSENMDYVVKDLRVKLPILLFPIVFSSRQILNETTFRWLIYFFIATLVSSTLASMINYFLHDRAFSDMRYMSLFISHIRFSLLACLAIVFSVYYGLKAKGWHRYLLIVSSAWILYFLLFTEAVTGLVILTVLFPYCWYQLRFKLSGKRMFNAVSVLMIAAFFLLVGLFFWIGRDYHLQTAHKNLPDLEKSADGCIYEQRHHNLHYRMRENGYFVFQNICYQELYQAWNERSQEKLLPSDPQMSVKAHVLIRFLTSKGWPKDRAAVNALSKEEIHAIENGTTNVSLMEKPGIYVRLHELFWEIENYVDEGNFNGHSLAMRLEFWKTGWHIIQRHPVVGVGTGDIDVAFQEQYETDRSALEKEWRFRSHNQWITMAATFGIPGLLLFIAVIFIPVYERQKDFLYTTFALVLICSMLTEDTIDTQIGVTFYAFFNSLLLFQAPRPPRA